MLRYRFALAVLCSALVQQAKPRQRDQTSSPEGSFLSLTSHLLPSRSHLWVDICRPSFGFRNAALPNIFIFIYTCILHFILIRMENGKRRVWSAAHLRNLLHFFSFISSHLRLPFARRGLANVWSKDTLVSLMQFTPNWFLAQFSCGNEQIIEMMLYSTESGGGKAALRISFTFSERFTPQRALPSLFRRWRAMLH